jgi:hypothetical protein
MFLGQTGLAIGFDSLWILAIRHPSARATQPNALSALRFRREREAHPPRVKTSG